MVPYRNENSVIMPVNIPRLIQTVKTLNNIKPNSISDLEPRHYFAQMKHLMDSIISLPEAREPSNLARSKIIAEANDNSTILFKIALRFYLSSTQIFKKHRLDKLTFD
jgi:hypothetical protein